MGRRSAAHWTRWRILASEKPVPRVLEGGMMEKGAGVALKVDDVAEGEKGCEEEKELGAEEGGAMMMQLM